MATLTTNYQLLEQKYIGTSGGNLYVRLYAKYSEQDVANNRTKVQYQARIYYENSTYIYDGAGTIAVSGDGASYQSAGCTRPTTGESVILTTEGWVTHNNDGTKSVSGSASINFPNWGWSGTATATATLPTIPRASSISCNGGDIGASTSITISRASSSFTHTIEYSFGNLSGTIITKTSNTSINWTIPTTFYAQIPNSNTGSLSLTCKTYNGSTLIGTTTITCTVKVTNSNPIFNSNQLSYLDSNSSIVAITQNNQHIVRNNSNLKVTFTNATGKNSATIDHYEITFNGNIQTKNSGATINYGLINASQNLPVYVKAIDSRGNSTTISKVIVILDWINPSAVINYGRINNYEDDVRLKVNATISSVDNKNRIESIVCKYKKITDETFTNELNIYNNTLVTISVDKLYAWDFKIIINDKFGTTIYNITIAKGVPIMFVDTKKLAVGINKFPSNENSFDLEGNFNVNGEFKMYDSPVFTYSNGTLYINTNGGE